MNIPLIKAGFLAKLGDFIFEPKGMSFQKFDRDTSFNWAELKRMGSDPLLQYLGKNGDKITITGVMFPHYRGKISQLKELRTLAAKGLPQQLIAADSESGQNLGKWVVLSIKEGRTLFTDDGKPLKIEFSIELQIYAEDL